MQKQGQKQRLVAFAAYVPTHRDETAMDGAPDVSLQTRLFLSENSILGGHLLGVVDDDLLDVGLALIELEA
jgi:hypothetical protein